MSEAKPVVIYTDGACSGNPGPGGWAAILTYGDRSKEISGGEAETTNNRMELTAAISALDALKQASRVELHTDSEYVMKGITQWIHGWKRKGWRTAGGRPCEERRPVAAARCGPAAPSGRLAMGARPCRAPRERAGRRARARGAWRPIARVGRKSGSAAAELRRSGVGPEGSERLSRRRCSPLSARSHWFSAHRGHVSARPINSGPASTL